MKRLGAILLVLALVFEALFLGPVLGQSDPSPTPPDPPVLDEPPEALPPIESAVLAPYFQESYDGEPFSQWARRHLPGDTQRTSLWHVAPLGRDSGPAATLAEQGEDGLFLPAEIHQALVSPIVDLTAVPALEGGDGAAGDQTERTSGEVSRSALRVTEDLVVAEPEQAPRAPARLVLDHRFSFPDDRFDDGSAQAGFTIEARTPGGQWVPLEPAAGPKTARSVSTPLAGEVAASAIEDARERGAPVQDGCVTIKRQTGQTEVERTTCAPDPEETLTQVEPEPVTEPTGTAAPTLANAYVRPLEARGFTGTSDYTGEGNPDVVRHAFDLSPWAGREVELRFRAGTSLLEEPDAFWAIDRVQVEAASHVANLRVRLASPQEGHLAPPGDPFPVRVRVENVGQAPQAGPFTVNVTVDGPAGPWTEHVTLDGPLGFLEHMEGQVNFTPTTSQGYTVHARIESDHLDANPDDDQTAGPLPVGVDRNTRIQILREDPVLEPGNPTSGTVVIENRGNVPVDGGLTLAAHAYDAFTRRPVGDGIPLLATPEHVELPPSEKRHPLGVDKRVGIPFEAVLPEGAHVIIARMDEAVGTAPVGVGAAAPPTFVEGFEVARPGEASFELLSEEGTWEVRAESDLRPGLVSSGSRLSSIEPGTPDGRGAWVSLAHSGLVLNPVEGRLASTNLQSHTGVGNEGSPWNTERTSLLESSKGPVSVTVLSREVDLRSVSSAELNFLASLSIPPDDLGLTQFRVHVAPKTETPDLVRPFLWFLGLDNMTEGDVCPGFLQGGPPADACVPLEREVCLPLEDPTAGEACFHRESAVTDPCTLGVTANHTAAEVNTSACLASAPRWDALGPLLAGDLVHHQVRTHPWERASVDLTPYAGSVVEVAFVLLSEAKGATITAKGTGSATTLGSVTPETLRSMLLLDQVHVLTDHGLRLEPWDVEPAGRLETRLRWEKEDKLEPGWRSLGFAYRTHLGVEEHTLHSRAQLMLGEGHPPATGVDPGRGILLGSSGRVREGIEFLPTDLTTVGEAPVERWPHPYAQPAVTVVRSPTFDLGGLQEPTLEFFHRFNLVPEDLGGQPIIDQEGNPRANNDTFVEALQLPPGSETACDLPWDGDEGSGDNRNDPGDSNKPLHSNHLKCLLDLARRESGRFDIQREVLEPNVTSPPVGAGMFLRIRVETEDGWTEPEPIEPIHGYRFPTNDPGGYEPTLDYRVRWMDGTDMYYGAGNARSVGGTQVEQQLSKQEEREDPSRFNGQPVWAGDSDVTEDGIPDWVPMLVDLSPWAGRRVQIEFVLDSRTLTRAGVEAEPWAIDDLIVSDQADTGRVTLEELEWPHAGLPLLAPGEPLPVRLTATSPTGLDGPVHAQAVLQDAEGCVRATVDAEGRYRDETGRMVPLPAGVPLDIEMRIPPKAVAGPPPWHLHVAVDTGRSPHIPVPARVDVTPGGEIPRDRVTGVYNITGEDAFEFRFEVQAPSCSPQPLAWLVNPGTWSTHVGSPTLLPHNNGKLVIEADPETRKVEAREPNRGSSTELGHLAGRAPILVVAEGSGSEADLAAIPLLRSNRTVPVVVEPEVDRASPHSIVPVRVRPREALTDGHIMLVPLHGGDESSASTGSLSPTTASLLKIEPTQPGPHLIVVTGRTADGRTALGAAGLVAVNTPPTGDPILPGRVAQLELDHGQAQNLRIESFTVDPPTGISTQERELRVTVQNPGNVRIGNVTTTIQAGGVRLHTESLGTLLPGEHREVATVYTPSGGSQVAEAQATSGGGFTSRRTILVDALSDLGLLEPTPDHRSGDGWRVDGSSAVFQNASGKAPRDAIGTLPLAGRKVALEGLADFTVVLDQDMDMERGFDGGQVLLEHPEGERVLDDGLAIEEMSPFSPVQGDALSGRLSGKIPISTNTREMFRFDEDLSLLEDVTGQELLEPLEEHVEQDAVPCSGAVHPGEEQPKPDGEVWCEWVRPLVPVPETGFRSGIWFFHVGPYLAEPPRDWKVSVNDDEESFTVDVSSVTQHLLLEADRDLVQAAQTQGSLSVSFPEARVLGNRLAGSEATISMCARFVEYLDDEPPFVTVRDEHRCSKLDHTDQVLRQRPWGKTVLRITDIPEGTFDLVRLEFELRTERFSGMEGGDPVNGPFTGWFIGPVTAEAGGEQVTWEPSKRDLRTDPVTGRQPDADWMENLRAGYPGRLKQVIDQSGLVTLQATVTHDGEAETVDTGLNLAGPSVALPLAACAWTTQPEDCTWYQALQEGPHGLGVRYTEEMVALSTVPAMLGLSCGVPFEQGIPEDSPRFTVDFEEDDLPPNCDPERGLGLGPQVLEEATNPTHPVLERTRRLQRTIGAEGGVTFEPHEALQDVSVGGTGYNLDYRLAFTVDLRETTGRTVADLELDLDGEGLVRLVARSEGSDAWEPMPVCPVGRAECNELWPADVTLARLNLTPFTGQRVEVGLHVSNDADRGTVTVERLSVSGGLLKLLDKQLALRAWTDPSVEGSGWQVEEARLFGRTFKASVGLSEYDSPLLVDNRIHVHPERQVGDDEVSWTSPIRLKLFNQGPAPREVTFHGTVWKETSEGEWERADEALSDTCEVSFEPDEVEIPPQSTHWWVGNVTFESIDKAGEPCFPKIREKSARHRLVELRIELEPVDEDDQELDATEDDNTLVLPLVADPFGSLREDTSGNPLPGNLPPELDPHQQGVHADIDVSPTRPQPGEFVTIQARLRAVVEEPVVFGTSVRIVDAGNGELVDGLTDDDADVPPDTRLSPYTETKVRWSYRIQDAGENATLVNLTTTAEVSEGGTVTRHAWFQTSPVEPWRSPAVLQPQQCNTAAKTYRSQCTLGPGERFGGMAPPVLAVRADWNFPRPDGRGYAQTGWALQMGVCTDNGDDTVCPAMGTDPQGSRAEGLITLPVLSAPPGTLATLNPCSRPFEEQLGGGEEWCEGGVRTTARETWANVGGTHPERWTGVEDGPHVLAGLSPGTVATPPSLVLISLTDCSSCPDWNGTDRNRELVFRIIVFNDGKETGGFFRIASPTVAPVAVSMEAPDTLGLHAIPEAEEKALFIEARPHGVLGATIDPTVEAPGRWQARINGLHEDQVLEDLERARVLTTSPISPAGTSQTARIGLELGVKEDDSRSPALTLPVQTQPGSHPDLVVERIRLPSEIQAGDDITVEATVRNVGAGTSPPVPVSGVVRFEDGTVQTLAPARDFERIPSLLPGSQALALLKWTPQQHGTAIVRVAVDLADANSIAGPIVVPWGEGVARELRECRADLCPNVGEWEVTVQPPPVADLSVDLTVHGREPLVKGEPVDVEMTVRNAGPATVPRFEARLLAGVVSLLEKDPLVVQQPLEPGDEWSTTVTLIPPRVGAIRVTASAFSAEHLVEEARHVRSDGSLADEDNVQLRVLPVVAHGLELGLPSAVEGGEIPDTRQLSVPLTVVNRGTEVAEASLAALGQGVVGTLVGSDGALTPSVLLEPGETREGILWLEYAETPSAGYHDVRVEAASAEGSTTEMLTIEVPRRVKLGVAPGHATVEDPLVNASVPVRNEGNGPVTAQVGIDAPGLDAKIASVSLQPGEERVVHLEIDVRGQPSDGSIWVRSGTFETRAPLLVEPPPGPMPAILDTGYAAGDQPHVLATVANAGTAPTFDAVLTLARGNETLHEAPMPLGPGEHRSVEIPVDGRPSTMRLELTDGETTAVRVVELPDLRPRVRVDGLRLSPPAPRDGERVEVRASFTNVGAAAAQVRPGLFVDGTVHRMLQDPIQVEPGSFETVSFAWRAEQGEHTIAVAVDPLDPQLHARDRVVLGTHVNVTSGSGFWTSMREGAPGVVEVPGFGAWGSLAAGLCAALIVRRRRRAP